MFYTCAVRFCDEKSCKVLDKQDLIRRRIPARALPLLHRSVTCDTVRSALRPPRTPPNPPAALPKPAAGGPLYKSRRLARARRAAAPASAWASTPRWADKRWRPRWRGCGTGRWRRTECACTWRRLGPRRPAPPWCCSFTASRTSGTAGATRWPPWRRAATAPWPRTSAATATPTPRPTRPATPPSMSSGTSSRSSPTSASPGSVRFVAHQSKLRRRNATLTSFFLSFWFDRVIFSQSRCRCSWWGTTGAPSWRGSCVCSGRTWCGRSWTSASCTTRGGRRWARSRPSGLPAAKTTTCAASR